MQGAFWGLMIGLVVGVIRMVMDFSYKAPLCMEVDERPAFISQVYRNIIFLIGSVVSFVPVPLHVFRCVSFLDHGDCRLRRQSLHPTRRGIQGMCHYVNKQSI